MKKLFWGFFLIYLNFNFNVNAHTLNILPDFVGYILLLRGMEVLEAESGLFRGARPFAIGMAVYTGILWVGALIGVGSGDGLSAVLSLAGLAVSLYVAWVLIQAVLDMESRRTADLNGDTLYKAWKAMLVVQMAAGLLGLLSNPANIGILAGLTALLAIVGLAVIILYLMAWWKSAAAYETLPDTERE